MRKRPGKTVSKIVAGLTAFMLAAVFAETASAQGNCVGDVSQPQGIILVTNTPATVAGTLPSAGVGHGYQFDVWEAGNYTFTFCSNGGGTSYDPRLCIFNFNFSALLASNDDFCGLQSQITIALTPGVYHVTVNGWSSSFGSYTLAYYANVPNAGVTPAISNLLPATGIWVNTTTPTLSADVARSVGATNVHAEFNIDGAGYVDGTSVAIFGTSTHTPTLAEGAHTWLARAHDDLNVFSADTAPVTLNVDTSPPLAGTVNDGTGADIDWQGSTTTIAANWTGFDDPDSGIAGYQWAIGTTPGGGEIRGFTGVGLSTTASIGGLSLQSGVTYYVTVRATNLAGDQVTATSDGVALLTVGGASALADGLVGTAYADALAAAFGTPPHTFTLTQGIVPPGVTLDPDGTLSGTPDTEGMYLFAVEAQDSLGAVQNLSISALVLSEEDALVSTSGNPANPTSLPWGSVGANFSQSLGVQGGQMPYVFQLDSGSLPPGLRLESLTGEILGAPTTPGTYEFTVLISDTADPSAQTTAVFDLVITGSGAGLGIVTPALLPDGNTNCPYGVILLATGGVAPYVWSVTAGNLPDGVTIDSTGSLNGIPSVAATFNFDLTVKDATMAMVTRSMTVDVSAGTGSLTVTPTTLPVMAVGNASNVVFAANGVAPHAWSVSSGALPPGLNLDPVTGELLGTPTTGGAYRFVVTVVDSGVPPSCSLLFFEIIVLWSNTPAYLIGTASPLPQPQIRIPYSTALSVIGGTPPHLWYILSGGLPQGLVLDTGSGEISGTPTQGGTFTFIVAVNSTDGNVTIRQYSLTVSGFVFSGSGSDRKCGLMGFELLLLLGVLGLYLRRFRSSKEQGREL